MLITDLGLLRRMHSKSIRKAKFKGQRKAREDETIQGVCGRGLRQEGHEREVNVSDLLVIPLLLMTDLSRLTGSHRIWFHLVGRHASAIPTPFPVFLVFPLSYRLSYQRLGPCCICIARCSHGLRLGLTRITHGIWLLSQLIESMPGWRKQASGVSFPFEYSKRAICTYIMAS